MKLKVMIAAAAFAAAPLVGASAQGIGETLGRVLEGVQGQDQGRRSGDYREDNRDGDRRYREEDRRGYREEDRRGNRDDRRAYRDEDRRRERVSDAERRLDEEERRLEEERRRIEAERRRVNRDLR